MIKSTTETLYMKPGTSRHLKHGRCNYHSMHSNIPVAKSDTEGLIYLFRDSAYTFNENGDVEVVISYEYQDDDDLDDSNKQSSYNLADIVNTLKNLRIIGLS